MSLGRQLFFTTIIIGLLIFTFVFNRSVISIRLGEIDNHLHSIAKDEQASSTFSIISRYELIKRRMSLDESTMEDYSEEGRMQVFLAMDTIEEKGASPGETKWHPVKATLAGVRFILGKKPLEEIRIDPNVKDLERGYLLERNRQYEKAIKLYNDILTRSDLTPKVHASVLIHKAFCLSLISQNSDAVLLYNSVIEKFPHTPEALLSQKLIAFLTSLEEEKKSVVVAGKDSYAVGKKLYRYMDYRGAVKELKEYIDKGEDTVEQHSARYYKGRAHEELGEYTSAVAEYKTVISRGNDNDWAQRANRRLVMLGNFYKQKNKTINEAKKNLTKQGDTLFLKNVEAIKKIEKLSVEEKKKPAKVLAPLTNIIDSINQLDSVTVDTAIVDTAIFDTAIVDTMLPEDSLPEYDSLTAVFTDTAVVSVDSSDSLVKTIIDEQKKEKARIAAEKLRREKARQERLAREKAQKAERERLRKEQEERRRRAQEEAQRLKEVERERKRKIEERKKKLASNEFRNPGYIRNKIKSFTPRLTKVYLKYAAEINSVNSMVTVQMEIAASGKIKGKIHSSNISNRSFKRELVKEVESWKFPPVDPSLGAMRIRYPFLFSQKVKEEME